MSRVERKDLQISTLRISQADIMFSRDEDHQNLDAISRRLVSVVELLWPEYSYEEVSSSKRNR